jgi:hypothetical protein
LRVSNSTTVVCFSHHVDKSLVWDLIVEIEELGELILGNTQIRCRELVRNVPAEGAELSSLKAECVEEAQAPKESSKGNWLVVVVKLFIGDLREGTTDIVT